MSLHIIVKELAGGKSECYSHGQEKPFCTLNEGQVLALPDCEITYVPYVAPAQPVSHLQNHLEQIGIDVRQAGNWEMMLKYISILKEEIEMTERFLKDDNYVPPYEGQV